MGSKQKSFEIGKHQNSMLSDKKARAVFESVPISRAILTLAIPTVISQLITTMYNLADTYWVGQINDSNQLAALAVAFPTQIILTAIANLFGIGAGTCVSRFLGEDNRKRASQTATVGLYAGLVTAFIFSLFLIFFRPWCLVLLGSTQAIESYVNTYLNWAVVCGGIFSVFNMLVANIIRGEGMSKQASFGLSLGGILNIVLDPFFVLPFGFGMEIKGAAFATFLSNVCTALYFGFLLWKQKGKSIVSANPRGIFSGVSMQKDILLAGLPSALQSLLSAVSNITLNSLIIDYGEAAEAAIGITKKIDAIPLGALIGLAQGTVPLIAYNYGAKNHKRMNQTLRTALFYCMSAAIMVLLVTEVFAELIITLFIHNVETVAYGTVFLRLHCASVPFMAFSFLFLSFFQATKENGSALFLSIIRKGIADIPLMILLNLVIPMYGVIACQPIMDTITALCAILIFIRVRKKQNRKAMLKVEG